MGHAIIIGQTESGKTTLCKRLAAHYKRRGIGVVVLDPMHDAGWPADFKTADSAEFLAFVKDPNRCLQCACFVDETGLSIDKYDVEYQWMTCQSRHHGHVFHLIAQRAQMISPNVRAQCSTCYAFNVNIGDAKLYAAEFNSDLLMQAPTLRKGEFVKADRFGLAKRYRLW